MQNAPGDSAVPGALGLGQSRATTVFNAYYMFSFLTPIPFAVLSDAWIGRYKVLCFSLRYRRFLFTSTGVILTRSSLYLCGTLVQFVTSLPSLFDRETGVAGLAVSMVLIGLGVGGTKATFTPFIGMLYYRATLMYTERSMADMIPGDQYPVKSPQVKSLPSGERVIIDRTLTVQYIYNIYYW